ncbi:MAG: Sulfate/thiosulfate import ATP-binding protein CysA [Syntrophaceae bacterium PtaB.Bin095]|jgi:iron(III) transport system ATP-binding protein|nr:MAG: Sulfate/thiosulfate import ATP-binding protein CysA [Syntrophaceae bacterium PtaB.Bin095]
MKVVLKGISKIFGKLRAVDGVSLEIEDGDFFTLLGPSGCGKTTLLRVIAGFYPPDEGEVYFGERLMNDVPPHRRETGMVFQNYALFPHLNVRENIAYGLRVRKVPDGEMDARIGDVIRSVRLDGLEKRFPGQLSGGQQQRVALARALVISPQILLMDEPLSNLDAKLRVAMREEIRRIQKDLRITTIYVTHDQEEAMAVSDRIAILNLGKLEQLGAPDEIYFNPCSRFAAEFMGGSNILELTALGYDEASSRLRAESGGEPLTLCIPRPAGERICLSVRPEWVRIVEDGGDDTIEGTVESTTFLGALVRYRVRALGGQSLMIEVHNPRSRDIRREGDPIRFRFDAERLVMLGN